MFQVLYKDAVRVNSLYYENIGSTSDERFNLFSKRYRFLISLYEINFDQCMTKFKYKKILKNSKTITPQVHSFYHSNVVSIFVQVFLFEFSCSISKLPFW